MTTPEGARAEALREIERLITVYGNLSFECGAWQFDDEVTSTSMDGYRDLAAKTKAAKAEVMAAISRAAQGAPPVPSASGWVDGQYVTRSFPVLPSEPQARQPE